MSSQNWWSTTPAEATQNPPPKQSAATNIARRGPTRSSHAPNAAADSPRNTIAVLKIQASVASDQSLGAEALPPMSRERGILKTLNAYTWPIERWIASAAGGTSQRLYPGFAIECSRSRKDRTAMWSTSSWVWARRAKLHPLHTRRHYHRGRLPITIRH